MTLYRESRHSYGGYHRRILTPLGWWVASAIGVVVIAGTIALGMTPQVWDWLERVWSRV